MAFDIRYDQKTGFKTSCNTIVFLQNEKNIRYEDYISNPIVDICDDEYSTRLMMNSEDPFDLMALAISIVIGEAYYEYDDYELTKEQWFRALDEADKMVNLSTVEEFKAHFMSIKENSNCDLMFRVNRCANRFFKDIELHRQEAKDIRKWSELAFTNSEKVIILGY